MRKILSAVLLLTATMAFAKNPSSESKINVKDSDAKGVPTFVTGELGQLGKDKNKDAADVLKGHRGLLGGAGTEEFEAIGSAKDNKGHTHIRLQQKLRGLPVYGAEYIVHADGNGKVYAINGRFAPDHGLARNPTINGWSALERAASQAGVVNGRWNEIKADLVYVVNEKGSAHLAWRATVEYVNDEGEQRDIMYADATSGDLVVRAPQIHRARNRNTYNGNNGSSLPGTLVLTETGGSTGDSVISTAHGHAATSYDYYFAVHGRDSFNNAGAQIRTTVHHQVAYNNAFWNGSQLVYGDGDGSQFSPLGNALDVGAHELSHAVTTYSANLTYSYESGALNEGTSDIMAAAVEAWKDGAVSTDTWKVGEDITTPGVSGDALRYMNDPIADGSSYDYYPTRYTGTGDSGGVHLNSGIANLAFKLWVTGGTHPRGKTTVVVPALNATAMTSIDMAAKIWYRALTVYMTSSTNFQGARTATAQAATDLYGATAAAAVHLGWDAVGVPGTPGGGGGTVTLTSGVAVTGIGASTGSWKHYKIAVPTGQSQLQIVMSGGTGDGDLYVKRGAQPTSSVYDYRPYLNGNNETVTVANPVAGDWFISIYAYSTFSGVTLTATYTGAPACTMVSGTMSGTGANVYQPQYVSAGSGSHTGKLTGPAGTDFDLYLQKLSGSTWTAVASGTGSTSTENVTYSGTAGTYRWRIHAYTGSGTYTLCTTKP